MALNAYSQGCVKKTSVSAILTKKMLKNNKSGIRGVCWITSKQRWLAQIEFQGKHYNLGYYDKKEDAAAARKEAEEALFWNFLEWFKQEYPERWEKIERRNSENKEKFLSKYITKLLHKRKKRGILLL